MEEFDLSSHNKGKKWGISSSHNWEGIKAGGGGIFCIGMMTKSKMEMRYLSEALHTDTMRDTMSLKPLAEKGNFQGKLSKNVT